LTPELKRARDRFIETVLEPAFVRPTTLTDEQRLAVDANKRTYRFTGLIATSDGHYYHLDNVGGAHEMTRAQYRAMDRQGAPTLHIDVSAVNYVTAATPHGT
jgi:hypothetical protein